MDDRYERGVDAYASQFGIPREQVAGWFEERYGARFGEEAINAAGGAWPDDCLSLRDRSLVVVVALVVQGALEDRLRGHVRLGARPRRHRRAARGGRDAARRVRRLPASLGRPGDRPRGDRAAVAPPRGACAHKLRDRRSPSRSEHRTRPREPRPAPGTGHVRAGREVLLRPGRDPAGSGAGALTAAPIRRRIRE